MGEEPFSVVTGAYNRIMAEVLPQKGVQLTVVPRKESAGAAISASSVRAAIKEGNWELLGSLVPETTLRFLRSEEASSLREKIRAAGDVVHY